VIDSVAVNVPTGYVIAIDVLETMFVIIAVAPLVPPVIVSDTAKEALDATVIVRVPTG
tara:strand:- start:1274 stop:1447 length:174 start_codon:yes stop_codon:yes gene_type:complete